MINEELIPLGALFDELKHRIAQTESDSSNQLSSLHGRQPPHALDAERGTLCALLIEPEAFEQVSLEGLRAEDFYHPAHAAVYSAMVTLQQEHQPINTVTVVDELIQAQKLDQVGGPAFVAQLETLFPTAAHVGAYAKLVKDKSTLRKLITAATKVVQSSYKQDRKVSDVIDEAERVILQIRDEVSQKGMLSIQELVTVALKRLELMYNNKSALVGLGSGFTDFDRLTSGLQPGELIIIAARPSMGKTAFTLNIAAHVAMHSKVPVAFFSLEMGAEQLVHRLIGSEARLDLSNLRRGMVQRNEFAQLVAAAGHLGEAPLYIDETPSLSIAEMRNKCRRMALRHDVKLVIVDYLQLMTGPEGYDNKATEVAEISKGLKSIARELKIPVIALSQLNRGVESRTDKRPMMSDLRECVTGDTLVMLSDGRRVPIIDLVGQTPSVLAVTEQGRIIAAQSDKVWSVGKKPVFKVQLASGRMIKATAKHRLFAAEGWRRISELRVGDRLATAHILPEPPPSCWWPELRLALLGQLMGDGSYLSGQPMRYTTCSEENSEIVREAAEKEFGATVTRHKGRSTWHQLCISGNGDRWHPKGVNLWLRQLGVFNQRSHEKRVPQEIFSLSNKNIAVFLRHLWATDGTIHVRKSKGSHGAHYSTNSPGLAFDVAALLLRFGIVARIRKTQKGNYRPGYLVWISGTRDLGIFLDKISAFGPRSIQAEALSQVLGSMTSNTNIDTLPQIVFDRVRETMQEHGISQRKMANLRGTSYGGTSHFSFAPSRELLADYAEILDDDALRAHCNNDLFWDRIVAIEPVGEEEVFDLTVPGPQSWLADGIVSHNSGAIEQDADVIAFLYREEYYLRDKTPEDKQGIAEIIVAKNRNGPTGQFELRFFNHITRFADLEHSGK